jgi:hypothetical protein
MFVSSSTTETHTYSTNNILSELSASTNETKQGEMRQDGRRQGKVRQDAGQAGRQVSYPPIHGIIHFVPVFMHPSFPASSMKASE